MRVYRFYLKLVFLICLASTAQCAGNKQDSISIGDIINKLNDAFPGYVVGWERVLSINAIADEKSKILSAIASDDIEQLQGLVKKSTAYQCITGKNYFVFVPKDDPSTFKTLLTSANISWPDIDKVDYIKLLTEVKSADATKAIKLSGPMIYMSNLAVGDISIKEGQGPVYSLLNQMAQELHAGSWVLAGLPLSDTKGKPLLPMSFSDGAVEFYTMHNCPYR